MGCVSLVKLGVVVAGRRQPATLCCAVPCVMHNTTRLTTLHALLLCCAAWRGLRLSS